MDIKVPHLAEGVNSGTVVNIFVKEGDKVKKGQDVCELETEKAVAGIPSPSEGIVSKVLISEGDSVAIGQTLITLKGGSAGSAPQEEKQEQPQPAQPEPQSAPAPLPLSPVPASPAFAAPGALPPAAPPSVRRLARQLGLDLSRIRGTESGGRISMQDVKNYVEQLQRLAFSSPAATAPSAAAKAAQAPAPSIDFSKWGPVERKPMSSLRKKISERMVESWTTIPHVTQFDEVDISSLLILRKKYLDTYDQEGVRLTVTSMILKALIPVLKRHPLFNASIDETKEEIVFKHYIHLGIAVDTEQGLIVPVLRDADKKSVVELSRDLQNLAQKTRERKVSLEDLQGGTFTISNQGGIGGLHFTPIVNKPEVAILGLGQGVKKPVVRDNRVEIGTVLPLTLSYDHRLIDGGKAARFIKDLAEAIVNFRESDLKVMKMGKSSSTAPARKAKGKKSKGKKSKKKLSV